MSLGALPSLMAFLFGRMRDLSRNAAKLHHGEAYLGEAIIIVCTA